MRNLIILLFLTLSIVLKGQETNENYSVFNPNNMKKYYFASTNSGVLNTPYGLKIGFICNPGLYLGFRYGEGETHFEDITGSWNEKSNLYSIVGGLNKPLIMKNNFKLVAQLGVGYGQWWDYREESWTKSGYEIELGLLLTKKKFLLNITGNLLNGNRTYATGDFCVGLGYIFN